MGKDNKKKKKHFFRKIEVDGKTYKYKIGKSYTVIRGDDDYSKTIEHHKLIDVNEIIVDQLIENKCLAITPSDISDWIKANKK